MDFSISLIGIYHVIVSVLVTNYFVLSIDHVSHLNFNKEDFSEFV